MQKHPTEVFYEKASFKNFAIFTGRHLCWSLFLVAGLQVLRTPIFRNVCERLLSARYVFKNLTETQLKCLFQNSRVSEFQNSKDCLNYLKWVIINSNFSYYLLVSLFVSRDSISLILKENNSISVF